MFSFLVLKLAEQLYIKKVLFQIKSLLVPGTGAINLPIPVCYLLGTVTVSVSVCVNVMTQLCITLPTSVSQTTFIARSAQIKG